MEQKRWEDLELKDGFMFAKVMRDKQICIKMLERLLDVKIADNELPRSRAAGYRRSLPLHIIPYAILLLFLYCLI